MFAVLAACGSDASGPGANPQPEIGALSPSSVASGEAGFTLRVTGRGFVPGSVVQWNGERLATLVNSSTEVTAPIPASHIATAAIVQVTVSNPTPGGGTSASVPFTIGNPVPVLTSMLPAAASAGGAQFTLSVRGSNFVSTSVVRWNGDARPTTFVSATELTATIPPADIATAGTHQVSVYSAEPGGGSSSALSLTVTNPRPTVAALAPNVAPMGGAAFTLTVNGDEFVPTSIVRWNGAARPTTFVSRTQLTAAIPASDLSASGTAQVTVVTPTPGGGESTAAPFTVGISSIATVVLQSRDLVYDRTRERVYASVASTDAERGNSIARIDPATGSIEATVFVGSNPGKLAISDDGQFLYVSLDGAAAVRRVDLATFTAELQFGLGSGWTGNFRVEDMEVLPGNPRAVAISRRNSCCSPRHEGVAIYDDGVMRPRTTPGHTGSNVIEFSADAHTLYGYNNETTDFGLRRMVVSDSGVVVATTQREVISGFNQDMRFAAGRLYATNGAVVNAAAGTLVATIPARGFVSPDPANERVFYLEEGSQTVRAFSTSTFTSLGSLAIPGVGGAGGSLIRWGSDGLAFRTTEQVVLVRASLVNR